MPIKDPSARRKYHREWMAARREKFFEGKSCKCGATEDLTLTRRVPGVEIDRRFWSWSEKRRTEHARKFRILCRDCHVKWWRKSFYKPRKHGTNAMYRFERCRCEKCATWNRLRVREDRRKRRERLDAGVRLYQDLLKIFAA